MKRLLNYTLIASIFLLNIIGRINADIATPFVDTGKVGEISEGYCWLISENKNDYLVIVHTDTAEFMVLSAIDTQGVVNESLLGKPVILKAKVLKKEIRENEEPYILLEILSVKPTLSPKLSRRNKMDILDVSK
ncbi:MAG: hypothetical protein PHY94_07680 [Candidatus Omnitrophica bacterium]|nr:hypothetical protein [Candidatus Omnitrophota bacterium]